MASLLASFATVGGATLLSRVLGFARDLTIARVFGADAATDAFFVAFKIPNFARRLFAEGAFALALVPVLTDYRVRHGLPALKSFVDDLTGTLAAALLVLTGIGVLAAPLLILAFAPGFAADAEQWALATTLLRLTLPYLVFITLTALASAILNTYERFGVPALTPALLNLVLIGCALWWAPHLETPIVALAGGVLIAGVVQLAFQWPFLRRLGLWPRPRLRPRDAGVLAVLNRLGPTILGGAVGQISLLLDTLLASILTVGSISWLYYSDRLMELPLGLLGAALGTTILPRLAQYQTQHDTAQFSATLDWALRCVVLLGFPAAVGLFVLAEPIIATLFLSAAFSAADVIQAAQALMAYAIGIPAFLAVKVLVPGFQARQDVRTPLRMAFIALGVGVIVHFVLMMPFGHTGLALGTTLTMIINAGLLWRELRITGVYQPRSGWRGFLIRTLLASLMMGLLLYWGMNQYADWLAADTMTQLVKLSGWIIIGSVVYVAIIWGVGMRWVDVR